MRVRWISRSALVPSLKRRPPMASISSMKMMQGWCSRAYPNISRISRALSPMYLSTMAEETTFRKLASMLLAMARASSVLPAGNECCSQSGSGTLQPCYASRFNTLMPAARCRHDLQ